MSVRILYAFEDVGDDLPRPPLAAMRALLASGVVLSPRGWDKLGRDARWGIATAGVEPKVNVEHVQSLLRPTPVSELRLVPRLVEPGSEVPENLVKALGPGRQISSEQWQKLRPVDQYVLTALSSNTRLLWRAMNELFPDEKGKADEPWKATVAHCELSLRPDVIERLRSTDFLDGRAFVLARAAGVRTARRASETFDLRSESTVGTVELDWACSSPNVILWQAHVSMWDGAFFPAASLAAASAAAVAVFDIARELDPDAKLTVAGIDDQAWCVGNETYRDSATVIYRVRPGTQQTPPPPAYAAAPMPPPMHAPPTHPMQPPPMQPVPHSPAAYAMAGAPGFPPGHGASPMMHAQPSYATSPAGPATKRPGDLRLSSKVLLGVIIGLVALTCLLAAAIIAVVLGRSS